MNMDWWGGHYMCHLAGTIGTLRIDGRPIVLAGVRARRGWRLLPQTHCPDGRGAAARGDRQCRVPPSSSPDSRSTASHWCAVGHISGPALHQLRVGKRLVTHQPVGARAWLQHVANAGCDAAGTSRFLWHWVRDRMLAERKFPTVIIRPRKNLFSLDFNAEQVPNPDSRVRLAEQTDRFGMPRLHIDWRYTEMDVRTVATAFQLLQQDVARSGLGS